MRPRLRTEPLLFERAGQVHVGGSLRVSTTVRYPSSRNCVCPLFIKLEVPDKGPCQREKQEHRPSG